MSEHTGSTGLRGSMGTVLGAFAIGALAGAVVALLYAPASGEETRRKLGKAARDGRERAEALAREGRLRAEALARGGREFIERQRENIGAAVERGREVYEQVKKETV